MEKQPINKLEWIEAGKPICHHGMRFVPVSVMKINSEYHRLIITPPADYNQGKQQILDIPLSEVKLWFDDQHTCTVCKGKGKQTTTVVTVGSGKPEQSFEMDCIWCNKGIMTNQQLQAHKDFTDVWCRCEGVDHDVKHYQDGEHPELYKHHYRHTVCGKVVQIG